MLSASLVTSAGNCAAAVSKITCRERWLAVRGIALRLTITTSAQDGSAASADTTAAPTCPVPPMIKTRNAILVLHLPMACGPFFLTHPCHRDGPSRSCCPGSSLDADMRAQALSRKPGHIGAVAFSRTGDPATGDFGDAKVIKKFGEVPDDLSTL